MKRLALSLAVLLLVSNAFWLYRSIDIAVTNAYREQESYELRNTVAALSGLASNLMQGMKKADAIPVLQKLSATEEPYEKDGSLHTTWLTIALSSDGKVIAVNQQHSAAELPSQQAK